MNFALFGKEGNLIMSRKNQDCRYAMVVVAAKRARQLLNGTPRVVEGEATKPVTIALEEIQAGKINWFSKKEGIK